MKTTQELQTIATQVRRDILRMTTAAKSGHPGGSLGTADWMTAMQFNILDHDPDHFTMDGNGQDMLFVSQGHITPVIYSTMARRGFFPISELKTFRQFGTRLQGHPSTEHGLPGIRMASGSLGQGMSVGIGAALGKKMTGDNHLVYTLHGDGELQEGQIWEAVMFAGAKHVDNLIATSTTTISKSTAPPCRLWISATSALSSSRLCGPLWSSTTETICNRCSTVWLAPNHSPAKENPSSSSSPPKWAMA